MIIYNIDIMHYLPEKKNTGTDKDRYKYNELCYYHCDIDGVELLDIQSLNSSFFI